MYYVHTLSHLICFKCQAFAETGESTMLSSNLFHGLHVTEAWGRLEVSTSHVYGICLVLL